MTEPVELIQFEKVLEAMLHADINISATAAAKQPMSPYKHASDITRNAIRRALLKKYADRQLELRHIFEQSNKLSKTNLTKKIADLEYRNSQLQEQRDLLIASHKAMILAVGEMGGMAAWKRFFDRWQEGLLALKNLDALPSPTVLPLNPLD